VFFCLASYERINDDDDDVDDDDDDDDDDDNDIKAEETKTRLPHLLASVTAKLAVASVGLSTTFRYENERSESSAVVLVVGVR